MAADLHHLLGKDLFLSLDMVEGFTCIALSLLPAGFTSTSLPSARSRFLRGCYGPRELPLHFHRVINEHIVAAAVAPFEDDVA